MEDFQNITYPILKPHKSTTEPASYRPIPLPLTPSKIRERLFLNKIYKHIPLDNSQHGFRLLHSTITLLTIMTQHILPKRVRSLSHIFQSVHARHLTPIDPNTHIASYADDLTIFSLHPRNEISTANMQTYINSRRLAADKQTKGLHQQIIHVINNTLKQRIQQDTYNPWTYLRDYGHLQRTCK